MYNKRTLPSGLTVLTAPLRETQTVTVLLLVKVGSRYEEKTSNGYSHFLEHLMFKGTTKRPSTLVLSRELDAVGADYNAFTGKDHTGYYIKVNAAKLELALDLLADMIFNSLYDGAEIEREKGVIGEEINMYQDNPLMFVEDMAEEMIFSGNHLGWLISGSKQTVQAASRQKLLAYRSQFYQPANMVLTLAGKVNPGANKLINKYFGGETEKHQPKKFEAFKTKQTAPRIKNLNKKTDQVQAVIGWPGIGYDHPDVYAAYLLAIILGGNMSSRLFIEVRERRGLCYYIRAMNNVYQDTGCFLIQAGLDKKRVPEAVKVILGEVEKLKNQAVKPDELKRAQEFLRGKLAIELEDSEKLADWYGKQELLSGEALAPEEKIKKILAVKPGDISRLAKKLLVKSRLNIATIGGPQRLRLS
ncbi:MAG: pitrilysin family protein [Patescibacteria group bacterium]|jgi:predicted Zn-dependent peptidase